MRVGKSYRVREDDVDRYLASTLHRRPGERSTRHRRVRSRVPRRSTPSRSCPTTGWTDEFVGVVKAVIRAIAPHVDGHRRHPRDPAPRRPGRRPGPGPQHAVPRRPAWCWPSSTPASAPTGGRSRSRSAARRRRPPCPGRARQRAAGAGGGHGRRRPPGGVADQRRRTTCRRPGPTFAGRDVFAPAAAHLCAGVDLAELGEPVDPITLLPGIMPAVPPGGRAR